ncbi:hypothetical protein J3E68DRAFT_401097 [Trichoderma sp. SZMC 28012]
MIFGTVLCCSVGYYVTRTHIIAVFHLMHSTTHSTVWGCGGHDSMFRISVEKPWQKVPRADMIGYHGWRNADK